MADGTDKKVTKTELLADPLGKAALDYFLPKLGEARRSAVESRKIATRESERADNLQHELDSITPDAILDRMVDGWDEALRKLDEEIAKE